MRGAAPCISIDRTMEQYGDQDLDELLEEIPRATMAEFFPDPFGNYARIFGSPRPPSCSISPLYNGYSSEIFNKEGSEGSASPSSSDGSYDVDGIDTAYPTAYNYPAAYPYEYQEQDRLHDAMMLQMRRDDENRRMMQRYSQQYSQHYSPQQLAQQQELLHHRFHEPALLQGGPMSIPGPNPARWKGMLEDSRQQFGALCRYFVQGSCSRGTYCPFVHPSSGRHKNPHENRLTSPASPFPVPEKFRRGFAAKQAGLRKGAPANGQFIVAGYQLDPVYTSLDEVQGRIYEIARDQNGCRFLQRKFDEGDPDELQKIFVEIIDHITDLMKNAFGNYLVQKLLEVCTEAQRLEILRVVKDEIIDVSLNMHGTRAIQKLIDTLQEDEQAVSMLISSLKDGVVRLTIDSNGNHVVQRCLRRLSREDNQFIYDAASRHCLEISTKQHGCCVMQRCIDSAEGMQMDQLVTQIAANAHALSVDKYGNYVVQYAMEVTPFITEDVISRLEGNIARLAMNKFSSNVVEKCLELAGDQSRVRIIKELMNSPLLGHVLQDQFGNYVVQSALNASKGTLYTNFVDAIRPHSQALRASPYGKRILSRTNLRK